MPVALLCLDKRPVDDALESTLGASCEILLHVDDDFVLNLRKMWLDVRFLRLIYI